MAQYSSYKDSGFDWIGQIPSHWGLLKSKFLWRESFDTSATGTEDLLSVSQYDGVTPANGSRSESLVGYKVVQENNLVINIMLAWMGGLGVSAFNGLVSPAYCVYKLLGDNNPKYMHYLYKTPMYLAEFARHSTGVIPSRWRMYTDDFGQVLTLIPPRREQDAMVAYLDTVTAKIDEAIAQQQRMIDLLNERQRIIIERAVTKGINEDVELIDSGVDYIGAIPSHWESRRLGVLGQFTKGGNISRDNLDEDGPEPAILYGDIYTKYFVKVTDIKNHISSKTASASVLAVRGDLLMTGSGETKEDIGKTVVLLAEKAFIGGDVIQFKQTKNDSRYLSYVLNSKYSQNYRYRMSKGEIVVHIYPYSLKDLRITLPPVPEQKQIADYLDTRLQAIDNLKQVVLQQIDILQEKKQIIVNDVVTGRVKV